MAMLQSYPGSPDAYVYGPICVAAAARGKGIAEAMFSEVCRLLPEREGILFINAGNLPSIRAHQKMGMQMITEFIYSGAKFLVFAYRA
jgi:hypothetical protein